MKTTYELHEGISGNGSTIWLVVAVNPAGQWVFTHKFTNKAEALNWMKWC